LKKGCEAVRILYLDCFSGISGDMSLAALVDAGADVTYIENELAKIQMEPFSLIWRKVNKRGISAMKMDVNLDPNTMPKHHRHYSEIVEMIINAKFSERATALSLAIFEKIGIAEAKIHDIPLEKVHFHEVGAIDSIVDVIGVALAIDSLAIDRILSSPVPLGSGTVHCDHGIYPVPAPATLEMMRGLPIAPTDYKLEMTTPTGAGIISGVVDNFSASLPQMTIESIGYGAGTRDLPNQPNVLRVVIGKQRYKPLTGRFTLNPCNYKAIRSMNTIIIPMNTNTITSTSMGILTRTNTMNRYHIRLKLKSTGSMFLQKMPSHFIIHLFKWNIMQLCSLLTFFKFWCILNQFSSMITDFHGHFTPYSLHRYQRTCQTMNGCWNISQSKCCRFAKNNRF